MQQFTAVSAPCVNQWLLFLYFSDFAGGFPVVLLHDLCFICKMEITFVLDSHITRLSGTTSQSDGDAKAAGTLI